jgi:hypothetical protein
MDSRYTRDEICPVHRFFADLKAQIPVDELAKYKFIRGHFPYDLVHLLPRKPRMITFLRHPVTHLLSTLDHLQRIEKKDEKPGWWNSKHEGITLDEFPERQDLIEQVANRTTAYLSGDFIQPNLELAKERLGTFDFVGITEEFDESLELLAYIFDFNRISDFTTKNVSPNREKRVHISQERLDQLAEINRLDTELYEYGLKCFQEKRARWLAEKETGELTSNLVTVEKPRSVYFDFRRVDPGSGWYVGEPHKVLGITRWSGPGTTSTLRICVSTDHDLRIRFRVVNAITQDVLESLRVNVNNEHIPLKRSSDGGSHKSIFEGRIPQKTLERNRSYTKIMFEVDKTIPADPNDPKKATRLFGLCYNWLHLYPI